MGGLNENATELEMFLCLDSQNKKLQQISWLATHKVHPWTTLEASEPPLLDPSPERMMGKIQ